MSEDVAGLRALSEAAAPGEWRHGPLFWEAWTETDDGGIRVFEVPHVYPDGATQPGVFVDPAIGRTREPDAAFIVAAVNYVRAALSSPETTPAAAHYWVGDHGVADGGNVSSPETTPAGVLDEAALAAIPMPDWHDKPSYVHGWDTAMTAVREEWVKQRAAKWRSAEAALEQDRLGLHETLGVGPDVHLADVLPCYCDAPHPPHGEWP